MKIPYSSLRNWINICRGGHQCQECYIVFPYKGSLEKHMTRNMHTSEGSTERKGVQQVKQFQSKFQSCNKRKRFYLRFRSKNSWKNVEKNSTLTKRFLQIYFSKDFSHFRLGPRKWTKLWAFLFFKHPITLSSSARLVIFQREGFVEKTILRSMRSTVAHSLPVF